MQAGASARGQAQGGRGAAKADLIRKHKKDNKHLKCT